MEDRHQRNRHSLVHGAAIVVLGYDKRVNRTWNSPQQELVKKKGGMKPPSVSSLKHFEQSFRQKSFPARDIQNGAMPGNVVLHTKVIVLSFGVKETTG